MKLTPDDPRLSAYLFGELPPAEAAAVERAVAADPVLRLALDELKGVAAMLESALSSAPAGLRPDQRESIRRAGREADVAGKVVELASARRGRNPWFAAVGAAAAAVVAIGLVAKLAGPGGRIARGEDAGHAADEIALLPMPVPSSAGGGSSGAAGGAGTASVVPAAPAEESGVFLDRVARRLAAEPLPDPAKLPRVHPLPGLSSASAIRLPSAVGHASYTWIRAWMGEREGLPPRDVVRIEELVNAFPLSSGDGPALGASPCPWNPSAKLVACTLAGPMDFTWSFIPAPGGSARLLAAPGDANATPPSRLPDGRTVTVLVEVVPAPGAGETAPGEFVIRSADGGTRNLAAPVGEANVPAMRQLGLMAAFGLWLRGEGVDAAAMEAILAAAGSDPDPGRADSRKIVREALDRAAAE